MQRGERKKLKASDHWWSRRGCRLLIMMKGGSKENCTNQSFWRFLFSTRLQSWPSIGLRARADRSTGGPAFPINLRLLNVAIGACIYFKNLWSSIQSVWKRGSVSILLPEFSLRLGMIHTSFKTKNINIFTRNQILIFKSHYRNFPYASSQCSCFSI